MYIFTSDMPPVAKGRPRIGKNGAYTPTKTRKAESDLKFDMMKWAHGKPEFPLTNACHITIHFYVTRPKSRKNDLHLITRPDLDNYIKLVFDAGNGVLWSDDAIITKLITTKSYAQQSPHIALYFDAIF